MDPEDPDIEALRQRIRWAIGASAALAALMGLALIAVSGGRFEPQTLIGAACLCVALGYGLLHSVLRGPVPEGLASAQALAGGALASCLLFLGVLVLAGIPPVTYAVAAWMLLFAVVQVWLLRSVRALREAVNGGGGAFGRLWGPLLVCGVMLGFAALVVPGYSPHPPHYDSMTLGELRTMAWAQTNYAAANEGWYGPAECLPEPARCLRGYAGPSFLDPELLEPKRHQYRRTFHPGEPVQTAAGAPGLNSYAFVAVPVEPERWALRSFCLDDTGVIRYEAKGLPLTIVRGRCPASLPALD